MKLLDKVVFITDADSKSGRALLLRLAVEGAHFIVNSASHGRDIQNELESCRTSGSRVNVIQIDLCKTSDVTDMLESMEPLTGTVDILIHNNNLVKPASVEYCEEDVFLEIMNANAKSAFVCANAVGRQMSLKESGKIVFVSSIHAEKPTGFSFAYSASKGAVKMLCREAALKLGRYGINVNSIELGPVEGDDERFKSDISSLYDSYQYKVPNAELGTHDDLAHLVLFLSTDDARYMNGADIRMDGGFLMHYMDFKMKRP